MDSSKCDIKSMMTAIKLCVVEKRVYTQEVLAVVFQQLMDQNPLPTLMMRTVLQSLNIHPKLSGFVMNMLQRLIVKQVLRPCLSVLYCHCCWKNSRISLSSKIHDTINFFLMLCFSLSLSLSLSFFLSFFLSNSRYGSKRKHGKVSGNAVRTRNRRVLPSFCSCPRKFCRNYSKNRLELRILYWLTSWPSLIIRY